jgi:predicted outer membrane protein
MNIKLAAWIAVALCAAAHAADAQTKTRRSRTVPGPYPKIIKLPRVAEAPDRPATGVLLYDTDLSGRDLVFFQTANETGLRQLALATLARERAESDHIKAVAATFAGTQASEIKQLARLASLKGLSLAIPVAPDPAAEFEKLEGVKFDKKWIERLVAVNSAAVTAYESGAQSADPEIKAFAAAMLPLAQAKLQIANRLAGKAPDAAANR